MTIRVLDSLVAEQIAAGEVIENPASVIKELVENALDAGARRVEVAVEGGGKKSIRVSDDGEGMSDAEVPLAFQRFATSKLVRLEDLGSITSLGFRGEALPSIAAVSRVSLTTRRDRDLAGTRITLEGGQILAVEETGAPAGTTVVVRDLFFNTPARLKFLRAPAVEASRISALLTGLALARPEVSFLLCSEQREVFRSSGDGRLLPLIAALYGSACAAAMLELEAADASHGLYLQGYISAPYFQRSSRRGTTFVVNGRVIKDPALNNALERGYGTLLPRGSYPVAVLHLRVPPAFVDINVHPAKREIRFQQPDRIKELIYRAVSEVLRRPAVQPLTLNKQNDGRQRELHVQNNFFTETEAASALEQTLLREAETVESTAPARPEDAQPLRLIGQFLHSYLVVQKDDELWLLDQHAAHERVLYHRLQQGGPGGGDSRRGVQLSMPVIVEIPPAWRERVEELLPGLRKAGFKMETFGDNTYIIRELPFSPWESYNAATVLRMLEELVEEDGAPANNEQSPVYKTLACHLAVKAHQPLSRPEMEQLLHEWASTPLREYCPHGRPAVLSFHRRDLEKGFRRKGG